MAENKERETLNKLVNLIVKKDANISASIETNSVSVNSSPEEIKPIPIPTIPKS